jgi:hypothetical protein
LGGLLDGKSAIPNLHNLPGAAEPSCVLPKHPRALVLATDLYKYPVVLLFLVRYLRLGTRLIQ